MIVNLVVEGNTKSLNHRKTQRNHNLLQTKGALQPNYKLWVQVFAFSLPGERHAPFLPLSLTPLRKAFRYIARLRWNHPNSTILSEINK